MMDEATLTLFSDKNSLGTCTRSLPETPGSATCVVKALRELHAAWVKEMGRQPRAEEPLFMRNKTEVLRRKDISGILKLAAGAAGIPEGRVS